MRVDLREVLLERSMLDSLRQISMLRGSHWLGCRVKKKRKAVLSGNWKKRNTFLTVIGGLQPSQVISGKDDMFDDWRIIVDFMCVPESVFQQHLSVWVFKNKCISVEKFCFFLQHKILLKSNLAASETLNLPGRFFVCHVCSKFHFSKYWNQNNPLKMLMVWTINFRLSATRTTKRQILQA